MPTDAAASATHADCASASINAIWRAGVQPSCRGAVGTGAKLGVSGSAGAATRAAGERGERRWGMGRGKHEMGGVGQGDD